jgi:cell division protein FtsL
MFNNLLIAAIIVVVIWIIILGIFLYVSRKQPNVAGQIQEIEEKLAKMKSEDEG